jgi:hypothetical protein
MPAPGTRSSGPSGAGERGFGLLTQRWRTLQHVTMSSGKIGQITRAALVLTLFEHKMLT